MLASGPLLYFALAILGAFLGLFVPISLPTGALAFAIVALLFVLIPMRLAKALCVCIAIIVATATLASFQKARFEDSVAFLTGDFARYEGTLLSLSDTLSGEKRGLLDVGDVVLTIKIKGAASAKDLRAGDRIFVSGKVSKGEHALSEGQVDGYWLGLSRGVHGHVTVSNPYRIGILAHDQGLLTALKERLRQKLLEQLTPREAALLLALTVGDVRLFDDEQQDLYRSLGVGHLLAVSGLQISILSVIFFQCFHFLFLLIPFLARRAWASYAALVVTLFLLWGFVLLCGAPPSAFRAGLMSTLLLCAIVSAWTTSSFDVFGAAGWMSVALNPVSVMDPSFWLSYTAVFALLVAMRSQGRLKQLVAGSLGAGLLTLPLSAFYFGEIAPSGLLVNLFLVPIASFLQAPAILLTAAGLFVDGLLGWAAFLSNLLEMMCMSLHRLVGLSLVVPTPSLMQVTLSMLALLLMLLSLDAAKRWLKVSVALALFAIAFVPLEFNRDEMIVSFLPVGQGDGAVLQIPPSKVMVIDGGGNHENVYNPGQRVVLPFLKRRGIKVIDVMVLSHPDADHLLGLIPLVEKLQVRELWHSGFDASHPLMAELIKVAERRGVILRTPESIGVEAHVGDARVRLLTPQVDKSDKVLQSTNNRSLVLNIGYQGKSVLFTGDIEAAMEAELVKNPDALKADVVKAPHHGSKGSSSLAFVEATKAKHLVFCTGAHNRFGFPHAQTVKRWQAKEALLWDTAMHGETRFKLSAESIIVKPYRTPAP